MLVLLSPPLLRGSCAGDHILSPALPLALRPVCMSHLLMHTDMQGDSDLVRTMLEADITLTRLIIGRRKLSPWHVAAEGGHVEVRQQPHMQHLPARVHMPASVGRRCCACWCMLS